MKNIILGLLLVSVNSFAVTVNSGDKGAVHLVSHVIKLDANDLELCKATLIPSTDSYYAARCTIVVPEVANYIDKVRSTSYGVIKNGFRMYAIPDIKGTIELGFYKNVGEDGRVPGSTSRDEGLEGLSTFSSFLSNGSLSVSVLTLVK